ncbi:cobalamin biosynthesis protein [Halobacterium salinarum]|uniref:Probable cobalamin biosynthesis protein CobD n=4 Tax=Halobacterium salinarum TaxID=2242 RepID=Q9HPL3_HALSA|nr:cobalamin biosynthesis protein [Halobacterium salinarum]AAG19854.1 hypothetical protein VNG_1578H [Halobacterium salinarum NRC-1]MBB6088861.1 adenosylcobinamide-phosphate synthase [Halobacterium salinarum]MDL0119457.1 cobalamin biosynthesis protein [Halobacterium salinarum]QCC45315.1 adenosylcobinamide-phosphate synthase [Halobacterium salinarum]TYO81584.1 adenosylcobinamide-phosphate synthase [Halobacterium salinarum DSM 3754]
MTAAAVGAVAVGVALDAAIAEPPAGCHPVAWFGRAVGVVDRPWTRPLAVGALAAIALPLAAAATVWAAVTVATWGSALAGAVVAGLVVFVTTSRRMLLAEASGVIAATRTENSLDAARRRLRALAGRDPDALSAGELRSAAVESTAENLADGLVAPLAAFAVGAAVVSLPVGAAAAAWVKAVNTLDSMLGYRSKRVGTASARLDDAVMWVPARLAAVLIAATARAPAAVSRAAADAGAPPSPNSGWPMATLAAVLDCRLVKPGVYELREAAALPGLAESRRGVRVVSTAGGLAYALTAAVVYAGGGGL